MVHYCSVPQCRSKWTAGNGIKFHSFPKDAERRNAWVMQIRSKKASDFTKVCSLHFSEDSYIESSTPGYKILRKDAIPTINLPFRPLDKQTKPRRKRRRIIITENKQASVSVGDSSPDANDEDYIDDPSESPLDESELNNSSGDNQASASAVHDISLNTNDDNDIEEQSHPQELTGNDHTSVHSDDDISDSTNDHNPPESMDNDISVQVAPAVTVSTRPWNQAEEDDFYDLMKDEIRYYTGLCLERFETLFSFCMKDTLGIFDCCLSARDQLLLTLCKYKLSLDYVLLGTLFRVTDTVASGVFLFWTDLIYDKFKSVDWWASRARREDFYTAFIDCMEIPTVKSSKPGQRKLMFSRCKNGPTMKGLVACDETGRVIYVSELYGGSISGSQIVKNCGFLNKLEKGDNVLADKYFIISDALKKRGVLLNIPPLHKNKKKLEEKEEEEAARDVLNRRIHMKRLIANKRKRQILIDELPEHLWRKASKIFYICMMMTNIKPGVVCPG